MFRSQHPSSDSDTAAALQREIFDFLCGTVVIGAVAQPVAALLTGKSTLLAGGMAICCIAYLWLARQALWLRLRWSLLGPLLTSTGCVTACGLFYFNNGFEGTHLYPLLWTFTLVSGIGLYGSWTMTAWVMAAGPSVLIGGKLLCPDLLFGVGSDSSWARCAWTVLWWELCLVGAGFAGRRVIALTRWTDAARAALVEAQAREGTLKAEADRMREQAAADREATLFAMAEGFDAQVRSLVTALAQTSGGIGVRAADLTRSAAETGQRVQDAAALTAAVAEDTAIVSREAAALASSLAAVREQAQGAAAAATAANDQMLRSSAALQAVLETTGQVTQAISLIGAIASRTNLLALNATIEAERAGAAGRGFAVVASEVKQLARRARATAQETTDLLREMERARTNATAALEGIGRSIDQASSFAAQVHNASDDQAAAVEAITRTISNLSDRTGGVLSRVTDVLQAARVTSEAAVTMQDAAATLGTDATTLQAEAQAFIARVRAA